MLTHLHISDYAIVQELDLELESGMTVMTGETGAGKSIAIDALGIALGDRADSGAVRHGSKRADITASFDISDNRQARKWLTERELDDETECTLRRTVSHDGKSRAYVNGRPAPIQQVRELADLLIDIHSQHQHQSLLRPDSQRDLLDAYAGTTEKIKMLVKLAAEWKRTHQQLETLRSQSAERAKRIDYLNFQLDELNQAAPQENEWSTLEKRQRKLANIDRIGQSVSQSLLELYDNDQALVQQVERIRQKLSDIVDLEPGLSVVVELLDSTGIQLQEAVDELRDVYDKLDNNPEQLQMLDQRMSELVSLARKHQTEPELLYAVSESLQAELDELTGPGASEQELGERLEHVEDQYNTTALEVTRLRHDAGSKLANKVNKLLNKLGMQGARLELELVPMEQTSYSGFGRETINFMLQTNPGQPAKPLAKIASGGELSRVSLAIQVVTAQVARIPVMVFDEVDVGIGGGVAEIVGQLLAELAAKRQVICITHQAQVAAQGQQHLKVIKLNNKKTIGTTITQLEHTARIEEIARMIGGITLTDATIEHAREMLENNAQPVTG